MTIPANNKTLLPLDAGASYLILSQFGRIGRWWPTDGLYQSSTITGEQIKQIRQANDWTQSKLGQLCGCGKSAVANWEADRHPPSVAALMTLYHNLP